MQKSRKRDKRTPEGSRLSGGFLCCTNFTRPTGNLDSRSSSEIMELLKEANRKYKQTIIMITHNLELAKQADRVLSIEDGCVTDKSALRGMGRGEEAR